jgi:hypothetical protein
MSTIHFIGGEKGGGAMNGSGVGPDTFTRMDRQRVKVWPNAGFSNWPGWASFSDR